MGKRKVQRLPRRLNWDGQKKVVVSFCLEPRVLKALGTKAKSLGWSVSRLLNVVLAYSRLDEARCTPGGRAARVESED